MVSRNFKIYLRNKHRSILSSQWITVSRVNGKWPLLVNILDETVMYFPDMLGADRAGQSKRLKLDENNPLNVNQEASNFNSHAEIASMTLVEKLHRFLNKRSQRIIPTSLNIYPLIHLRSLRSLYFHLNPDHSLKDFGQLRRILPFVSHILCESSFNWGRFNWT